MSSNPIILDPINDQNCEGGQEEPEDVFHDWDYQDEGGNEVHEVSPIKMSTAIECFMFGVCVHFDAFFKLCGVS
jgi:hypothetical protein